MDITFVLCPNIIGLLGLSILLIFTKFNFYIEKENLKLFRLAAIVNLLIIAFEVADYMLGQTPFDCAYLIRRFTTATGFALTPVFPLLLVRMAYAKKPTTLVYIPAALNIIISYASMFTGHMFLIDSCNSYYRGPLFIAMVVISILYLVILIFISFKNLQSLHYSESVFLIYIVIVIVIGNLLEILFYFHFILWNSCAVLLVCYYLYLHIQYFKYDPLTKVFNRNMFTMELSVISCKNNVGIVSFDLDNLKKINDEEGHESGDNYIVESAHIIENCFSDIGRVYRIGGDEFVVLVSNTTEKIICDKIQLFYNSCKENNVSVSCGYSFLSCAVDVSQMLNDADKAMYENKRDRKLNR